MDAEQRFGNRQGGSDAKKQLKGLLEFLHTGGGQPPAWYVDIVLARLWHCKPWEIEKVPTKWVLRELEAAAIEQEVDKLRPGQSGISRLRNLKW